MKKILNFFKKNWFMLATLFVGVVLMCLGVISAYFLMAACGVFSIICFYFARKLQLKYNQIKDEDPNVNIFDGTKLDFDEDVYYIGSSSPKKQIGKSFFGQLSAKTPSIALYILAVALLSLPIITLIRLFL